MKKVGDIVKDYHKRMVQIYGEDYNKKVNKIKDDENSSAVISSKSIKNGVGSMIKPSKKPKVYTDQHGRKHLTVPVHFNIPIYLEHGEKSLSLNEIKNRLDEFDSSELIELVFGAMDYKNVIKG